MREICFVTGAHVDQTARLSGSTRLGYSNPGVIANLPGGAGLNSASATAALGLQTALASPVGDDANAILLRETLRRRNIADALVTMAGARTGLYSAIVAADGDLILGVADLALYEAIDADWFWAHCGAALDRADAWVLNANLSPAALEAMAQAAGDRFLAVCTVSPEKAPRLRPVMPRADILFGNLDEARALLGRPDASAPELAVELRECGVKAGTISQGPGPVTWWRGGATGQTPSPPPGHVVDVVGAGDALAGTVLAGLARGLAIETCVRYAIAAAQLTIATPEPVREDLSWAMIEERALAAQDRGIP